MPGLAERLPFYPNEGYLRRNWAPEQIPVESLQALAAAQAMAEAQGILPPSLAAMLLPIAITEGRWGDFGVNQYGYPPTPERDARIQKMGMTVGDFKPAPGVPPESENWSLAEWDLWEEGNARKLAEQNPADVLRYQEKTGDGRFVPGALPTGYVWEDYDNPRLDIGAKMAAIVLREKMDQYGPDLAVERWNGKGQSGKNTSSKQYVRKVQRVRDMLDHPSNAEFRKAYGQMLLKRSKK